MEFIDGQRLADAAQSLIIEERVSAVIEVLDAVAYVHSHAVLHRDIKPTNIVLAASNRRPVLVDFGAAYLWDELTKETLTRYSPGTPGYIPLEVLSDPKHRDPRHDIYSMGATLYQVITGRTPRLDSYEPVASQDPALGGLDGILRRALAREEDRFANAATFATQLREWLPHWVQASKLGPSPMLETVRSELRKQRELDRKLTYERTAYRNAVLDVLRREHAVLCPCAEAAFREIHALVTSESVGDY